MLSKVSILCL